ncbi:MAG: alkaline phosphatase PhoX, partial [Thermoleophilaceae bacterium]
GRSTHVAAAVDPAGRRVYLTEDLVDGGFYRFTPTRYPDLGAGVLEIATVRSGGSVSWTRVPDPAATGNHTRDQVPGATEFKRGEGLWFDSGVVYISTTTDGRIHAYDTATETIEVLYDKAALEDPPIEGVDNITVTRSGDLFVCEDTGADTLDIAMITPERTVSRFLTLTGPSATGLPVVNSELTGVVFDPSGSRMYFGSQRGFGFGVTYEVSGPFRARAAGAGAQDPGDSDGSGNGDNEGSSDGGGEGDASPGFEEHRRDPSFTG